MKKKQTLHTYGDTCTVNTTVRLIYDELLRRDISVELVPLRWGNTLLLFEYAGVLRAISGTSPDITSATGRTIASNKYASFVVAQKIGMKTPETVRYLSNEAAARFLKKHGRIVVKPLDSSHGNGVSVDVTTEKMLGEALEGARCYSTEVLLQQMVCGADLRVLVIGGRVAGVVERQPASVLGDGSQTLRELIVQENNNPLRGENYEKPLNKIDIAQAEQYLGLARLESVPGRGEPVQVVGTANIGSGGKAVNRAGRIPKALLDEAVRFATTTGLFVCGVDFMYDEASTAWNFIEANSSPSFGLHTWPSEGEPVDVAKLYVETLLDSYAK